MKSVIIILVFLGVNTFSYSQSKTNGGNVKLEELPEVVLKSASKDFSVYLPDKNPDQTVRKLQEGFVAYDLGKDYEGYERYLVTMEVENGDGTLVATYNESGKLIRVVEKYQNVKLPSAVIYSVYKEFPGWKIVDDKFLYAQEDGDIIKKQYTLKLKKEKETRKIVVSSSGQLLKS
jgi:hypothetical protein